MSNRRRAVLAMSIVVGAVLFGVYVIPYIALWMLTLLRIVVI